MSNYAQMGNIATWRENNGGSDEVVEDKRRCGLSFHAAQRVIGAAH